MNSSKNKGEKMRRRVAGKNNNISAKESSKTTNIVDVSLYIAIISALGYFVAYSYKKGYMKYYGINEVLLTQINISHILISISVIGTSLLSFYCMYYQLITLLPKFKNPIWIEFRHQILVPLFGFGLIMGLFPKLELFRFFGSILIIWVVFVYSFPLFSQRQVKGYLSKLQRQIDYEDEDRFTTEAIIYVWRSSFPIRAITIIIIFALCQYIANAYGLSQAAKQEKYLSLNHDNKTFLIIDNYGDNFIIAPVDLKEKKIKESFQVIELNSELDKPTIFTSIVLKGGVTVKEPKEYK
ncbi:hypothetical protein F6Y03_10765 [Bacillus megaterium]|nr:hypothetical protein [Priestia megaterium]